MKNTQKVTEKSKESTLLRNGSNVYLEQSLGFKVEDDIAYCQKCPFKTEDYFDAEDHWYQVHNIW